MEESYETFEEELWPPRAEPRQQPFGPVTLQADGKRDETPWENVTLNRCLVVVITVLVLTSGFQRLNESLRCHGDDEDEEVGVTLRRSRSLRRSETTELHDSLWDILLWWLPDLDDDDDDEDEDGERKGVRSKGEERSSLRNRRPPPKALLKQKEGKVKKRSERSRGTKSRRNREQPDHDEHRAGGGSPQKTNKQTKKSETS